MPTSAARPPCCTRRKFPPSTPSAPSFCASGATCWTCPPTSPSARMRRPRSSWPGPWTRSWRSGMKTWTPRGTLPSSWTSSPPGGMTAAWWISPWTSTARPRATPTPPPGWRTSGPPWISPGSPTWARPPGADSCWRMPARPWTTGQGRWSGPVIWPRETPFWKRPTCPVSPPPSRTWKTWPRPSPTAGTRPPSAPWTIPGLAGPRMWRT